MKQKHRLLPGLGFVHVMYYADALMRERAAMYPRHRLDGLGDAIYGVSMTLLVLDIRIPDGANVVDNAGFAALLSLADTGRACVKLSGLSKCSALPYPHSDAWGFFRALLDAYTPDSLVWASDWPFLRASARIDYGPLMTLFAQLLPDEKARQAVLWDTPKRLFGFTD